MAPRKPRTSQRREESLSRDAITQASIELLDSSGEGGLTFRALSERLSTGPGAIYWHVRDKDDLMTAACDVVVARTMRACVAGRTSQPSIHALAAGMFDAMDAHPWLGSALASPAGHSVVVRILEPLGQQLQRLGVPASQQWAVVSALLSYILGVGGRNAANGQLARARGLERSSFLEEVATMWSQLTSDDYPFTRSMTGYVRNHDDRRDFLAGIDLILGGLVTLQGQKGKASRRSVG